MGQAASAAARAGKASAGDVHRQRVQCCGGKCRVVSALESASLSLLWPWRMNRQAGMPRAIGRHCGYLRISLRTKREADIGPGWMTLEV